uniref:Putative mucin-5ac n=1 Tax=Rhipicephalus pulchellus TaxID=72859 RepID=L7LVI6_RHIPC
MPMPPMPPMPPIPPMPPMASALSSLGSSTTTASAVVKREATPDASSNAVRTTLVGSMMPAPIIWTYSLRMASYPKSSLPSTTFWTTTAASTPAFWAICMQGCLSALRTIPTPVRWSSFSVLTLSSEGRQRSRAVPPPGTMPSSTAARVAFRASFTRSFFSFTSTSLEPPTRSTATPLARRASRSPSFSFSYSELLSSISSLICPTRRSMSSFLPLPLSSSVSSLVMSTSPTWPRSDACTSSSLMRLASSPNTMPPVATAMSCSVALRLSPKPGAFTAATCRPTLSLLSTKVLSASPSTSSAMMTKGRRWELASSRAGMMACTFEIFFSLSNSRASWNSTLAPLLVLMK